MPKLKTQTITVAGIPILVDVTDAERILSREWVVFLNEYIATFTNGTELLGNFILGLPQGVFVEQVNKLDAFNYTRRNIRPFVHNRPVETR